MAKHGPVPTPVSPSARSVGRCVTTLLCASALSCAVGDAASSATYPRPMLRVSAAKGQVELLAVAPSHGERLQAPSAPTETRLRRLLRREVDHELGVKARTILDETRSEPFGAELRFELRGKPYAAVIERHYHAPGGEARPWGWHRGISLFAVEPVGA